MKTRYLLANAIVLATGVLSSQAAIVGGLDPATAPTTGTTSDTAGDFMVISNQFAYTTTGAETIDLGLSTFNYQSSTNGGASGTPFLAIQGGGGIHDTGNYDVIWVGADLANGTALTDVSGSLGAGTFDLPASSTIVGGFFASAAGTLSPVSAVFSGGTADDVLVIAQSTVTVAGDIALMGSDWSSNPAVTNRVYHYQIDLQAVPEPGSAILLGLAGFASVLRRRR